MATSSIPQLTQVVSLTGSELMEIAQQQGSGPTAVWASRRMTALQLIALIEVLGSTGPTGVTAVAPSVGENDNWTASGLMGPTIGAIDMSPIGNCNITGLQAGFDGQIVVLTNLTTFTVTLNALSVSSLSTNQFRMSADLQLAQNNGQAFKYFAGIGKWVALGG